MLDSTLDKDKPYFKYYKKYMNNQYPTILAVGIDNLEEPVFVQRGSLDKNSMIKTLKRFIDEQGK